MTTPAPVVVSKGFIFGSFTGLSDLALFQEPSNRLFRGAALKVRASFQEFVQGHGMFLLNTGKKVGDNLRGLRYLIRRLWRVRHSKPMPDILDPAHCSSVKGVGVRSGQECRGRDAHQKLLCSIHGSTCPFLSGWSPRVPFVRFIHWIHRRAPWWFSCEDLCCITTYGTTKLPARARQFS